MVTDFERHTPRLVQAYGHMARIAVYWSNNGGSLKEAFDNINAQICDLVPAGYRFEGRLNSQDYLVATFGRAVKPEEDDTRTQNRALLAAEKEFVAKVNARFTHQTSYTSLDEMLTQEIAERLGITAIDGMEEPTIGLDARYTKAAIASTFGISRKACEQYEDTQKGTRKGERSR